MFEIDERKVRIELLALFIAHFLAFKRKDIVSVVLVETAQKSVNHSVESFEKKTCENNESKF